MSFPSNFEQEMSSLKRSIELAMQQAADKVIKDYTEDINSRIKVFVSSDLNSKYQWFIMPKENIK